MADEIIFLGTWISLFSTRVKIALAEKDVDYEFREEVSNKSPLLLKANPVNKQIPVLIHNSKPVYESLIIVEYIDEVWNHKSPLLPSDPHQRAQARFWADYFDKKMYIAGRQLMFSTGEAQETVNNDLIGCLKQFGNFSIVAECLALVAWVHGCMEKNSVSKHLLDQHKVYDCILERKRKLEAE
ncbi:hypothetical protein CsSME_00026711 [Camellia sinensis var. sinensis]